MVVLKANFVECNTRGCHERGFLVRKSSMMGPLCPTHFQFFVVEVENSIRNLEKMKAKQAKKP